MYRSLQTRFVIAGLIFSWVTLAQATNASLEPGACSELYQLSCQSDRPWKREPGFHPYLRIPNEITPEQIQGEIRPLVRDKVKDVYQNDKIFSRIVDHCAGTPEGLERAFDVVTGRALKDLGIEVGAPPLPDIPLCRLNLPPNLGFKLNVKKYAESLVRGYRTQGIEDEIDLVILPRLKDLLINDLRQVGLSDQQIILMESRIRGITYVREACLDPIRFPSQGLLSTLVLKNPPTIHACAHVFDRIDSLFEIVNSFAHELTHGSLDPMYSVEIFGYTRFSPFRELLEKVPSTATLQCLMQDPYSIRSNVPEGTSIRGIIHLSEGYSDVVAARLTARYFDEFHPELRGRADLFQLGYMSANADLCRTEGSDDVGSHPRSEQRLNRILRVDPLVRQQLSCAQEQVPGYCGPTFKDGLAYSLTRGF